MSIRKLTMIASIEGDQVVRALRLPEMKGVEIAVALEITHEGVQFRCDSIEDAIETLKRLADPTEREAG